MRKRFFGHSIESVFRCGYLAPLTRPEVSPLPTAYRIYPKYSDTSTPYHTCSKIRTSTIHYLMLCLKIAGWVANSVDPDETPRSVASHLGLYCLLRPVCPNTYGKYGTWANIIGSGKTVQMNRLACTFTVHICYDGSFPMSGFIYQWMNEKSCEWNFWRW